MFHRELGLVDEEVWQELTAHNGPELVAMGLDYAREHFAAVLGEVRREADGEGISDLDCRGWTNSAK